MSAVRSFISAMIERAQAAFPVNRVVALLTPVFATAAGAIATYAVQKLPFIGTLVPNTQAVILGVFTLGAASAVAAAYKWLDGWQKHEDRVAFGDVLDTAQFDGEVEQPKKKKKAKKEPAASKQDAV